MPTPRISLIAAIAKGNRALGKNNALLWRIPDDLKRFKALTMGHPIVMGRKTFESIGRPLPGRTNIVVTRDESFRAEGVLVVHSISEALREARGVEQSEIFIIGGGDIYAQTLPQVDRLYLTVVDDSPEADAFFPDYSVFQKVIADEPHTSDSIRYRNIILER